MACLEDEEVVDIVKAMNAADSSSGKTGALACLVDAGFNLRFLDFDQGTKVLRGFVKVRENLRNVHTVDGLRDEMQLVAGRVGIKKAAAFQRAMDALDKGGAEYWGESGAHIPPLKEWTKRDILVLDSVTFCGRASLQMVMQANGKGMGAAEIQHYGTAMENLERLLAQCTSDSMPCHFIANTHVTSTKNGGARLYPEALGDKLPAKIGRYFNTVVSISLNGIGSTERTFKTKQDGLLPLKSEVPLPDTLPIATGWRTIFEAITGKTLEELLA
jgi:hypothetical protein